MTCSSGGGGNTTVRAERGFTDAAMTLTIATLRLLEEKPRSRHGDYRRQWVAVENKWLATRYGLDAIYIRTPGGKRRPLAYDLSELLERLIPVAKESGDAAFLASLKPVDKVVNGANRQREERERDDEPLH